ncbi:hypothetical protein AC579_1466 [Pseudocercospora musae]|uniref:Uncharacterized protein n=1 Tax=Pseudocercospora musae TaxID=113226 RepID=A0A139I0D2_9PEZI|nr:hypothetical protein AC579_1466 [Pseudocercospora musae]
MAPRSVQAEVEEPHRRNAKKAAKVASPKKKDREAWEPAPEDRAALAEAERRRTYVALIWQRWENDWMEGLEVPTVRKNQNLAPFIKMPADNSSEAESQSQPASATKYGHAAQATQRQRSISYYHQALRYRCVLVVNGRRQRASRSAH